MDKISSVLFLLTIFTGFIAYWPETPTDADAIQQHTLNRTNQKIQLEQIYKIRVQQWPPHAPSPDVFEAQLKEGMWRISSQHDFPADLNSRIGQIIGAVINLKRGPLISADPSRHNELRIVDPANNAAINSRSYGQRISLFDDQNNCLLDLIFGRYDQELERSFVRHAEQNEVYTTTAFLYLEAHWRGWVKQQLIEHQFKEAKEIHIQAIADKPFPTNNIFTYDNDINLWRCNGHPLQTPQVNSFTDYLLSLKLLDVLPLNQENKAKLTALGLEFKEHLIHDAPSKHLLKTRDGASYRYFVSNGFKQQSRTLHYIVIDLTPGTKTSASYRYRCKHFAFVVDEEFLNVLKQIPLDLLPAQ